MTDPTDPPDVPPPPEMPPPPPPTIPPAEFPLPVPPGPVAIPEAGAVPPRGMTAVWGERIRWLGIAGLFGLGVWLAYWGFTEAGLAILLFAIERLGNALELTGEQRRTLGMVARSIVVGVATAHGVKQVQDGVNDIRDNPSQGGTPTAAGPGGGGDDAPA